MLFWVGSGSCLVPYVLACICFSGVFLVFAVSFLHWDVCMIRCCLGFCVCLQVPAFCLLRSASAFLLCASCSFPLTWCQMSHSSPFYWISDYNMLQLILSASISVVFRRFVALRAQATHDFLCRCLGLQGNSSTTISKNVAATCRSCSSVGQGTAGVTVKPVRLRSSLQRSQ